jgi:hypothetical protein
MYVRKTKGPLLDGKMEKIIVWAADIKYSAKGK